MSLFLNARMIEMTSQQDPTKRWLSRWLDVRASQTNGADWTGGIERYQSMCSSLMSDIQSAEGSGASALEAIRAIEEGTESYIEADGNAHIAVITPHEVWFQNHSIAIDESPASFRQYKQDVET